ncbi:MAG: NADH-quinone oxidoreductase subunit J [Actinomycetia bacterium]|nr:NADH-quinone oxidoreductase subunit J [Actinomycetes bacterium]MCP4962141.1 NADH-quinone oxidoreductase subunit J [Actinomycetes bacterium]
MIAQNIAFGIIATVTAVSAVLMVTTRNVVHAALYLVAVLASLGALYVLLTAEFVATTQFLVYIGAVMVLFLFGVMLTRAPGGETQSLTATSWPVAFGVAAILAGALTWALLDQFGSDELSENPVVFRTADVGDEIFSTYLIAFEAASVLLLAALIGAIVLARKD